MNIVMQMGLMGTDVEECLVKRTLRDGKHYITERVCGESHIMLKLIDWVIPVGGGTKLPATLVGCRVKIPSKLQIAVDQCTKDSFKPTFSKDMSDVDVIEI